MIEIHNINIEDDDFVRHCYYVSLQNFKRNVRVKRLYEVDPQQAEAKEIDFLVGLIDDEINHLKSALEYISKNQRKQIIIFLDNCDQRSDLDQETAFLVSQEFATDWPVIIFVCLRPETFHSTKKATGALSGYYTKAFTIAPPRIDEVIEKRLEFAQKITSGEILLTKLENKVSFSKLHILIEVFRDSLLKNRNLYSFIENVSNGNIRKAIETIKNFFGSGHVDTEKIVKIYEETSRYTVPVHEFLRAVIYGNNVYYTPNNSDIVNLLDVRNYDPKEHFIVCLLLGLLGDLSANMRNKGFIEISEVYKYLQNLNFNPDQIDTCLNFMYSKGLFETSQRGNKLDTDLGKIMIRATSIGLYHINFLINSFTYVDAIIVDTPIFDEEVRKKVVNSSDISSRLDRATLFKDYLDAEWAKMSLKDTYFNWSQKSSELQAHIHSVKEKLQFKK